MVKSYKLDLQGAIIDSASPYIIYLSIKFPTNTRNNNLILPVNK